MSKEKKCCCAVEDEAVVVKEECTEEKECCKKEKCGKKCCPCCCIVKTLVTLGVGFLIGIHFRAIKAAIKGEPMPEAPKWHCWVKR